MQKEKEDKKNKTRAENGRGGFAGKSRKCYEEELDNIQKRHSFRSTPVIHCCIKKCKQSPQVILKFLLIAGYYCHFLP